MIISYNLTKRSDSVDFQITYQNKKVNSFFKFLKSLGYKEYMAKNGTRIRLSKRPEWRQSQKIIFLQGSEPWNDNRVDVTNFASKSYLNRSIKEFDDAMKEFADAVKFADKNDLLNTYTTYTVYGNNRGCISVPSNVLPGELFVCNKVSSYIPKTKVKSYNL